MASGGKPPPRRPQRGRWGVCVSCRKPRALSAIEAKGTLAHRLAKRVDGIRQIATRLGIRSRRVFLVWTKYDGAERGEGNEYEIGRLEILPTPRISDLTSVAFNPYSGGILPTGSVRVDRISALLTEDQLTGKMLPGAAQSGEELEEPYDFFWELVEDGRGDPNPDREKFRIVGHPFRKEAAVQWVVVLERISEDNDFNGFSSYGGDE